MTRHAARTIALPVARPTETLDPPDWSRIKELAHQIVEDAVEHVSGVRDRPVWRAMPEEVMATFRGPPPEMPTPVDEVYKLVKRDVFAYPMGNIHPRFWSWYMGTGNFGGALGDFLAAVQGSNLGGGSHAAALLDQQVVGWLRDMVGLPQTASGTLVSGGSMANLVGLTVARNAMAGIDLREEGVSALEKPLRFYASDQVHSCHRKAIETLGLGNKALRRIATDAAFRIDIATLRAAIKEDREAGFHPACIIGTAGTVNTGSIDDLMALADLAAEERLWFHIDGCIGALVAISHDNAWRVEGINRADSIALDPHKWLHAPFEVGCALLRDRTLHRQAFAVSPEYLKGTARGLASGEWLHEYGLQTSRGFSALKVWMALMEHGTAKFGRLIDQNIAQAYHLAELVRANPPLQLLVEPELNIACFRYAPAGLAEEALKSVNTEIMVRLQETGVAAVSDTVIHERYCLRAAICNHRTRYEDLELFVAEIMREGARLSGG
ncbi:MULTISPECIES: pyridoxal-dependent decarboxylase [unclassified Chelatococcus]|uniref:pyridoxal phosphate-dependent decarboxylase family protein n=1 Tax=unclassified Chelatococcus TaxID=2638111 RepID=UPI001BCE9EC4|nr:MULTISPECIES: pyridoxal-dependent decarboxylase [unclassified Chelatococcus]CAH1671346.1 Aspartate aminotransferase family protein [Hyphomicrobiales bacterium]MBS7739092.1 amino acid decarboxylase [Chelatococcus sp. HY11]MBX3543527.1 amino acid decarboxylase [Chelatococcus sp.]MCO5076378.1 pyridoxal-dependent decarboxylase [Chelatococcus sp.]CAH1676452.1 Aspartate aminotransferase family protein [Hyphomicrobiales bacterium]